MNERLLSDTREFRCGCFLSDLTGLANRLPATASPGEDSGAGESVKLLK